MECGEIAKKYEKVDSFLKRCLPHARYSGVRLIEPCVALSTDYNKQFKFAILAEDSFYVTENPPKATKDIQEVTKIVNITSVELLNDVPEFLGGDLKYRAHHILISYKKDPESVTSGGTERKNSPILGQKSPQEKYSGNSRLKLTESNFTRNGNKLDHDKFLENKSNNAIRRELPSFKMSSSEDKDVKLETGTVTLHHSCSSLDYLKSKNHVKPTRLTASANAADLKRTLKDIGEQEKLSNSHSGSDPNLLSSSQKERSLFSSFNDLHRRFKERRSSVGETRRLSSSGNDNEKVFLEEREKSFELHLYMLLDDTVMLPYLRSTWDNCLLNAALKKTKKSRSPNLMVKNKNSSSQVIALFDQLEKEILNSNELKDTFVLVHELSTACQKDVLVKKLFWQSPNLFVFLVQQLKYYNRKVAGEDSKANKVDGLEFIILLLECLAQMFRETELLAARMASLKTEKCRVVHDLIETTVFVVDTKTSTPADQPGISEAAEVLLTGRYRKRKDPTEKTFHDIELDNFSNELTKCQVTLLHELFIIAYQAAWFQSDNNGINICWMVKIVESSKTVSRFVKSFMALVMNLMKVAETEVMSAENATLLYRLFSVLKTTMRQSTRLYQHIQEYYTEEFRYFVKMHILSRCLSKDCPLTPSTLKLVKDVKDLVTERSLSSRCIPR